MSKKMHELLAVESDLQKKFQTVAEETKNTFSKKTEHFRGHHKTLKMKDEERSFEEASHEEHKIVDSTVGEKLDYTAANAARYFDALLQKEKTNQAAVADLEIDGAVLARNLPATFLLGMESRLAKVREYYQAIPTLQPGIVWQPDETEREGVYKALHPEVRDKTEKVLKYITVAKATAEHPAQVAQESHAEVIGQFTTLVQSGMITPGKKSELLERIDTLYQAVKKARARANQTEIEPATIGKQLFRFINSGEIRE